MFGVFCKLILLYFIWFNSFCIDFFIYITGSCIRRVYIIKVFKYDLKFKYKYMFIISYKFIELYKSFLKSSIYLDRSIYEF